MKPLLVSSGEPAGIGPDLCLALASHALPVVVIGDPNVLQARAKQLNRPIQWVEYQFGQTVEFKPGLLHVLPLTCPEPVVSGQLNALNGPYVLKLLQQSASLCAQGEFSALVTAPVHKANINAAGISFTGHTEFLADFFQSQRLVMMLACEAMRVALMTTHLPLRQVPQVITQNLVKQVILQTHASLIQDFGVKVPRIKVAGLNPHAGESGYLGREEIEVIMPALTVLKQQGIVVEGPLPADTLFTQKHLKHCDAFVAMYHDQGLPVLKHIGFNQAVNITLGLPIIRTSVDHGTALDLAGKGLADSSSLLAAVKMAQWIVLNRTKQ